MVNRLRTLYELQLLDNQLDELEELRGDLPITVGELNRQMQNIKDQVDAKESEKEESNNKRVANDQEAVRLKDSLTKYKAQLYQVRNNKEYDALTKEIDHSEEHIDTLESENKAIETLMEKLKNEIAELTPQLEELELEKTEKEDELKKIIAVNEKEEIKLREKREQVVANIRKSDYNTYTRIRKALRGKAVVSVIRGACTGCHNVVPSQRQIEIRQNKRIYTCESCGRILVSPVIAEEVEKN